MEIEDTLCILDAAGNAPDAECLTVLPSGALLGDIWPCLPPRGAGPDGAVEVMDLLAILDAAEGTPECPDPCPCE